MNNVIITQIKNQEERVYDWIFYHNKEGFDTFIFFDDFSEDGTISEIERFKKDFGIDIRIFPTDERGVPYTIEQSKNSEVYGYDIGLQKRIFRSYTRGNEIVKSVNPDAVCSFLDVDEFLVTNEEKKVSDVIREIFDETKCTQIFVYNFDIKHDYQLERNLIYKNENYYRWDYDGVNNHIVWKDRKKCITISKSTTNVLSMHFINKEDEFTFSERNYDRLRMHHFRIPNLPRAQGIQFVSDNIIKEKMINHLK